MTICQKKHSLDGYQRQVNFLSLSQSLKGHLRYLLNQTFKISTQSAIDTVLTKSLFAMMAMVMLAILIFISYTGLTPSPTFPPRGAEADMPGVFQYHVES